MSHIDGDTARPRLARIVTFWRPLQECVAAKGECRTVTYKKRAGGQLINVAPVQAFGTRSKTFGVKHVVHLGGV